MGPWLDTIGFGVRIVALLFTWLTVAMFVNRELAAIMGLVVIGLWAFLFLPLNYLREVAWQSRQKQIIDHAMKEGGGFPAAYQPGTALPGPSTARGNTGDVMVVSGSAGGGAVDVYRDLPSLPPLEPRHHSQSFWRSLTLPVVGLLMFLGAENDTLMHTLLEARGVAQKPPVAWERIVLPPALRNDADKKAEVEEAARLTLRRLPACTRITGGRMEAVPQFVSPSEQGAAIRDGKYVYVFDCVSSQEKDPPFQTWIAPDELDPGKLDSLMKMLGGGLSEPDSRKACLKAANTLLAPLHSRLDLSDPTPASAPPPGGAGVVRYSAASSPYHGHGYIILRERLVRAEGAGGLIFLSCWVDGEGNARARFLR